MDKPRNWYQRTPMYLRIIAALLVGVAVGYVVRTGWLGDPKEQVAPALKFVSDLVLRLLSAIATPLILVAVVNALVRAKVTGGLAARMMSLLMLNTVVAILVGLAIANFLQPGVGASFDIELKAPERQPYSVINDLLGKLPGSVLKPIAENDILGVIVIGVAAGIGLRIVRAQMQREGNMAYEAVERLLETGMRLVMVVLHWVIALVPLAVFAVVARVVGTQGLSAFLPMLRFVVAVLLALSIQSIYYIVRVRLGSWVRPGRFLRGGSDALLMAFSTASSAATMPVTYTCMKERVGVSEESASMGVMVGGTFNHDGTALYEASAALFISQVIGQHLGFREQVMVVLMSVVASVGAAGIPEAGLVTMLAVFTAVKLPTEYIPLLLTVDWFLDRCRTTINVLGDMSVTCMLDGSRAPVENPPPTGDKPATA
jgi:Na+/H+-dicarboxylate symporter